MKKNAVIRSAVVQASPMLFNRKASVEKAVSIIKETAQEKVRLILFPEAFIPAYPRGLSFGSVVGNRSIKGRELWQLYWENAVDVPGPDTKLLGKAAQEACVYLAVGVIERDSRHRGTLYCTLLYFGPNGQILGKHRKLKPTAAERIIWGEGVLIAELDMADVVKGKMDFDVIGHYARPDVFQFTVENQPPPVKVKFSLQKK